MRLLERLGHTVDFPLDQTCCGQMHYNTGYQREAIPLVRHFVEVFGDAEVVVSPSASCVGMVRELYPQGRPSWPSDESLARRVATLIPRVFELSDVPRPQAGGRGRRRLLPAPGDVPPDLPLAADAPDRRCAAAAAAQVRGIDLVELPHADECCGFGGTFAVKNADTSMAMLGDKLRCVLDTRAEFCAAADNSCLMHIGGALHRQRTGVRSDPPRRDPRLDRARRRPTRDGSTHR